MATKTGKKATPEQQSTEADAQSATHDADKPAVNQGAGQKQAAAGKSAPEAFVLSAEISNVSLVGLFLYALASTSALFGFLYILRGTSLNHSRTIDYITTLFLERTVIQHVSTFVFFLGFWFLLRKLPEIRRQSQAFALLDFPEMRAFPIGLKEAVAISDTLARIPAVERDMLVIKRADTAMQHLVHTESTAEVQEVLNTMSEADRGISYDSYSMIRFATWFIPAMGFLGTVLGISRAIDDFSQVITSANKLSLTSMKPILAQATGNLSVAFDTTVLALVLSATLVPIMFYVQRQEEVLLSAVDKFSTSEIVNRLHLPNPDITRVVDSLDVVANRIDSSMGNLNTNFAEGFGEKLGQFLSQRAESEDRAQKTLEGLADRLTNLVDQSKGLEGFVAGFGNLARIEHILVDSKEALAVLREAYETQSKRIEAALASHRDSSDSQREDMRKTMEAVRDSFTGLTEIQHKQFEANQQMIKDVFIEERELIKAALDEHRRSFETVVESEQDRFQTVLSDNRQNLMEFAENLNLQIQAALKLNQEAFDELYRRQQADVKALLGENASTLKELIPPIKELSRGIRIRVGE